MTLRTLNYGNYGIFLILGNALFLSSTARVLVRGFYLSYQNKETLLFTVDPHFGNLHNIP